MTDDMPSSFSLDSFSIKTTKDGSQFAVKVSAGAKKTRLLGLHGNALKISIQSPPADGKANKELVEFLAGIFGIAKSCVFIVKGQTSPHKVVAVSGINSENVFEKLFAAMNGRGAIT